MVERLNFSDRFKKWAVTLILLPVIVFYRFFEGIPQFSNFQLEGKIANLVVGGGVVIIWLIIKWRKDRRTIRARVNIYLSLLVLIVVGKLIFSSDFGLSTGYSLLIFSYILTFYYLLDIRRNMLVWESLLDALLFVACISYVYVGKDIVYWTSLFHSQIPSGIQNIGYMLKILPRLYVTLQPNIFAVNLLLVVPILLYRLINKKELSQKLFYTLILFITITCLILTKSRGGVISLGCMLAFLLLIYWKKESKKVQNKSLMVISFLFIALLFFSGLTSVFVSRGLPETIIPENRLDIWEITFRLVKTAPLFGIDLGSYGVEFINNRHGSEIFYPVHPHNEVFNFIVYFGIVGSILLVAIIVNYFKLISDWVKVFEFDNFQLYSLLGLLGFFVHGLIDSFLNVYQVIAIVLLYVVGLLPRKKMDHWFNVSAKRLSLITLLAVTLGIGLVTQIWKLQPYVLARAEVSRGDYNAAGQSLDLALRRDPTNSYYLHTKAVTEGYNSFYSVGSTQQAIDLFNASIKNYYGWAPEHANLAMLLSRSGKHYKAYQELIKAVEMFPNEPVYYCAAAEQLVSLGRLEKAINYYSGCLSLKPTGVSSPYWDSDYFRRQEKETIIQGAETRLLEEGEDSVYKLLVLYAELEDNLKYTELLESLHDEKLKPENLLYLEGVRLMKNTSETKAIEKFNELLQISPRYKAGWDRLAECYLKISELEKAKEAIMISLALKGSPQTYSIAGEYFEKAGNKEMAIAYYQLALINLNNVQKHEVLATWIAKTYPYPISWVGGLPQFFAKDEYYFPAKRIDILLRDGDCRDTADIYQQILIFSPELDEIRSRYHDLVCTKLAN